MRLIPVLVALAVFVPAVSGAADGARTIPAGPDEALVIPASSPVRLATFKPDQFQASFAGRFTITGAFTYGCRFECNAPVPADSLELMFIPDPADAARLPHWAQHHNDVAIYIENAGPLVRALVTPRQRAALRAGKLDEVTGRASIVVEGLQTSIECDSVGWSARFVKLASPPKIRPVKIAGDFGCS